MNIMDIFSSLSKHCRCSFNSLSDRCTNETAKWKRNSKTMRNGLPNIVTSILNKKWTVNVFNKYFRTRKKLNKANTSEDENLEKITVNNVYADSYTSDEAWQSIFVDLTKKGSMMYLIFVDKKTLYPEVFELGVRSLWKQTKRAFRDVFREYRIPVEIHTSEKGFFDSGKFVRFMKDHGINTATKSYTENNLGNVLASVKVLIHNSRFWHEELRKLRETISKSLLATEDKYVQVEDVLEGDMKFNMSDSSSDDDSSEAFDPVLEKYSKPVLTAKERPWIKPLLINKIKPTVDTEDANTNLITLDEQELDWTQYMRSVSISTGKYQKNSFINNEMNTTIVNFSKYPIKTSLTRNVTTIHHCEIEQNIISVPGIWKRTKNKLIKKFSDHNRNNEHLPTFHEKYDEMLNYLASPSEGENNSNDENSRTVHFDESNELFSKNDKPDLGDNCSVNNNVTIIRKGVRNGLTFMDNFLIKFPIEVLPFKYDNLFISQKDLSWKAVVVDVIKLPLKCYYMFIDCSTKFPELFLQIENKGVANVKFLIRALCCLWQIHGKPIEIHSPKGSLFSCKKLSRFLENYDMFFYYDSPFLRDDMKIGHIWKEYKNILGDGTIYTELLKIQNEIRKMTEQKEKREADKKRQKTLFSLNKTTIDDATEHMITKPAEGILQKESINPIEQISWRKIVVDEINYNGCYYIIFIDIETFYPHIKEIKHGSKLHSAKLLIKTFRKFFNIKSIPEEIHVKDKNPLNIDGVIRFMNRIGVRYYRQSLYFNGGNCVHKCLEHMKSLISQSTDLESAIYNCRKKPLPWLGLSPKHLALGHRMTPLYDRVAPPWAEIIIDIFIQRDVCYLIVFDYDSLYPECFHMDRNIIIKPSMVKIIKACKSAFSVVGCPTNLWTFDRDFSRSNSFLKFLGTRGITHMYLNSQKERETGSMLASFRQKLKMTGSFESALVSTREAYNHFIGACPVRRLREKETAVNDALQAAIRQRKHVRFNLPDNSFYGIDLSGSDDNY